MSLSLGCKKLHSSRGSDSTGLSLLNVKVQLLVCETLCIELYFIAAGKWRQYRQLEVLSVEVLLDLPVLPPLLNTRTDIEQETGSQGSHSGRRWAWSFVSACVDVDACALHRDACCKVCTAHVYHREWCHAQ